jgi:quercetin dioxygenase-like cupin family protein
MKITRNAAQVTKRGPSEYFTGEVWLEEIAGATPVSRARAVRVTFAPGARTAWHTHPHGQTLRILSGIGRVQIANEPVVDVHAGDIVWFEPGERHWHGAAPASIMVHLAIQQADDTGSTATWLEHVTDEEYQGRHS